MIEEYRKQFPVKKERVIQFSDSYDNNKTGSEKFNNMFSIML